jgi:flagellar biosynthesis protein FlhF
MTVYRFVAANAREALAQIRRELGDDAVVLSTRTHPEGVELLAGGYNELAHPPSDEAERASGPRILTELARLRGMLQNQLAGFAWGALRRRDPRRVALLQALFAAGFGSTLARALVARMPRQLDADAAKRWLRQVLVRNLRVVDGNADPIERGGVYALVGPTGAGKTTTLAKLAARGVRAHGAAGVALVSADAFRVGAAAQLRTYAGLLGVECRATDDREELAATLCELASRRLVLIDTSGYSPNDPRVLPMQGLDLLGVQRLLVLSAAQQGAAIEQTLDRFGKAAVACILSKVDESPQPGAALDALIRHRLPLAYVSSGQRVPEDLHAPNAAYLVDRALRGGQLPGPFALREDDWPLFAGVEAERGERRAG